MANSIEHDGRYKCEKVLIDYFIDRNIEFVQNGRVHTEKESKNIDKFLDDFLQNNNIEHTHVLTTEAIDKIVNDIVNYLEE